MAAQIDLRLTTADRQPEAADVAIIGGGVMGVSIAWHLAAQGVRRIVVIERDEFGSGSSAKPLGGVRANFSDPANVVLGQRSLEAFNRFQEDFGIDIGLRRVGYLFLARTESEAASLTSSTQMQNELGVPSRVVSAAEAAQLNPYLDPQCLTLAASSPEDGYARPAKVVEGYVRAAQELGVTFLNHTEVLGMQHQDGEVTSVRTNRGTLRVGAAIIASGAWSQQIAAMAGLDMPIEPVRRLIGFTERMSPSRPTIPFTLDLGTTFYFHNSDDGLLFGISHRQDPGFTREFSYDWVEELHLAAGTVAPSLEHKEIVGGWAGLYENTPDRNAYIGRSSQVRNVLYATGFSGHGFLQSPAVGELVADLYLDRPSFMDPAPFALERLSSGVPGAPRELHII